MKAPFGIHDPDTGLTHIGEQYGRVGITACNVEVSTHWYSVPRSEATCLQCVSADTPFTHTMTVYVSPTGCDVTGDGRSPETAYRTHARAMRDVPAFIPKGSHYIIDTKS